MLTDAVLKRLWPHCPPELRAGIVASAPAACERWGLTTPLRLAHAMAQFSHESGGGTVTHESLFYTTAARLRAVWPSRFKGKSAGQLAPLLRNELALADAVYNGRMGNRAGSHDGFNYRGRGLIQTTGLTGYAALAKVTGLDLVTTPDLVIVVQHAFPCAAAEFVAVAKCLPHADADDLLAVSALINVGHLAKTRAEVVGYASRAAWLSKWKAALGVGKTARRRTKRK